MTLEIFQAWEAYLTVVAVIGTAGAQLVNVSAGALTSATGKNWATGAGKLQIGNWLSYAATAVVVVYAIATGDLSLTSQTPETLIGLVMTLIAAQRSIRLAFEASYKSKQGNKVSKAGLNPELDE